MNKLGYTLAAAVSLTALPALAAPTVFELDPAHSAAHFAVKHMMVSTVRGEFGKISGTVTMQGNDWKTAVVEASIDASTINTREAKRDAHLKSADFFDVAKFATLTFKSKSVEAAPGGGYKLNGDLTIHGVTKPISFDVTAPSKEYKTLYNTTVVGASATAKLNRKDFGLNWNKPLEAAGGMLVGEEVNITLDLELVKKMPAAAAAAAAAPAKK